MRRSSIRHFWILFLWSLLLSGCSALVSPYSTTFQCPDSDKGKCVSVKTAYDESVDSNPLVKNPPCRKCSEQETGENDETSDESPEDDLKYKYQDSLYRKLTSIMEEPKTPVVIPPDVVRVLIISYTGTGNELFSSRYVYFFASEPTWSISATREEEE